MNISGLGGHQLECNELPVNRMLCGVFAYIFGTCLRSRLVEKIGRNLVIILRSICFSQTLVQPLVLPCSMRCGYYDTADQ